MAQKKEATKREHMIPARLVRNEALGIEAKQMFVAACGTDLIGPAIFVTREEAEEWRNVEGAKLTESVRDDVMTNVVGVTLTLENTRARRVARMSIWKKHEYALIEAGVPIWAAGLFTGFAIVGSFRAALDLIKAAIFMAN